ncbi:hypothetical protein LXL04_036737 [Taraxacum kok-saghyz]
MADYQQPIGEYMSMMLCDSVSDNEAMDDNLEEEDDEENVQNYELEDDDFIVDQENTIHDVDVDMADFRLNVDSDMERDYVLNGFPVDDEPEDMEVINNEDWESLDEGSDEDNKRRALIKSLGKPKNAALGKYTSSKITSKCKGKEVNSQMSTCSWSIHASRTDLESDWFITTMHETHSCMKTRKLRACTATFISKQILDQVEANPVVPLRALQDHIQKKYEVGVSMDKVYREKDKAKQLFVGDYTKQYELLRDYVLELQATNADTTVKIDVYTEPNHVSPTRQFKRIYVCLGPLKKGFSACLRDLLGLDGAFMKGPFPGQKWFLENLGDDLELGTNSNFTFITDRQKGLLPALAQVFPSAEHRYCIRHIHDNMKREWRPAEYRDYLWKCASATTIPEFEHVMREFSVYDMEACEWLKKIPPQHWARSHFTDNISSI